MRSSFISTDLHITQFLKATDRNWRNSLYLQCPDCPRACAARCRDLLCAFDEDGIPILLPVQEARLLWREPIDFSECLAKMPALAFQELYRGWIARHIRNPAACPLTDLYIDWKQPLDEKMVIFSNL